MKNRWINVLLLVVGLLLGVQTLWAHTPIDVSADGDTIKKGVLGHSWRFVLKAPDGSKGPLNDPDDPGAAEIVTNYLGPSCGGLIDGYNWKNLTAEDEIEPYETTLEFLRDARNRNIEMVMGVNCQGIGHLEYPGGVKTFVWDNQDSTMLTNLAKDWLRYVNYTVRNYRQGDTIPAGRDLDILNSFSWPDPDYPTVPYPELLGPTSVELVTPKVTYWQVGNEVDNATYPTGTYQTRYRQITDGMRAEDYAINGAYTIKVGPCATILDPLYLNVTPNISNVIADPNCHMDFVSIHPYTQLGRYNPDYPNDPTKTYWGILSKMEDCLKGLHDGQWDKYFDARAVVRDPNGDGNESDGRDPDTIEYLATEYNPMGHGWTEQGQQRSQYQALGLAETLFTFIDIGYPSAHFWLETREYRYPSNPDHQYQYPSYWVFQQLKAKLGDKMVPYTNDFTSYNRLYVSKNTQTGRVVLWGLNFDNDSSASFNLALQNLSLTDKVQYYMYLGKASGTTSLMDYIDPDNTNTWYQTKWTYSNAASLNPTYFTMTVPQAQIAALVLQPRVKNDFDGDGRSDPVIRRLEGGLYSNYNQAYSVDADTAALWHFDENSCAVGNSIPPGSYTTYDATTNYNDVTLYCGGSTAVDGVTRNNGFNAGTKQFGTSALDILASRFFGGTTHRNYEVWTGMNRSSLAIANNLTVEGWFYITGHHDIDNNKNATLLAKAYANKIEGVPIADTKEWLLYAFRDTGVSSNDRPISADIIDVDGNTRTVRSSVTWGQILDKWVHIAMSYSGTELKLHIDVNGDITATTATFGTSKNIRSVTDSAVTFLADPYGSLSTASIGKVDEVRISNVVRSFPPADYMEWGILRSSLGYTNDYWGVEGDVPLTGDWDGDGKADKAVYRPRTGTWRIKKSSDGSSLIVTWGTAADTPICGDYDGDGKTDITYAHSNVGANQWEWNILKSSTSFNPNQAVVYAKGQPSYNDVPIAGDYDNDKITDIAVYRPATSQTSATWRILKSSTNFTGTYSPEPTWGQVGDVPLAGDFDGDGRTDIGVYRPSNGTWRIAMSSMNTPWPQYPGGRNLGTWGGVTGDTIVTGDYDGDGATDLTYVRVDGTSRLIWYTRESQSNFCQLSEEKQCGVYYGNYNDTPVGPATQYK